MPEHNPTPDWFFEGHGVLTDDDHINCHETTRAFFDDRGVYDMTFGYSLARVNIDTRHPGAGYRYARGADDPPALRAEFTPTTRFWPQSDTLTKGSFRAWNRLSDRHEYELVHVRIAEMHHRSGEINGALEDLEAKYRDDGSVTHVAESEPQGPGTGGKPGSSDDVGTTNRGYGPDAPF